MASSADATRAWTITQGARARAIASTTTPASAQAIVRIAASVSPFGAERWPPPVRAGACGRPVPVGSPGGAADPEGCSGPSAVAGLFGCTVPAAAIAVDDAGIATPIVSGMSSSSPPECFLNRLSVKNGDRGTWDAGPPAGAGGPDSSGGSRGARGVGADAWSLGTTIRSDDDWAPSTTSPTAEARVSRTASSASSIWDADANLSAGTRESPFVRNARIPFDRALASGWFIGSNDGSNFRARTARGESPSKGRTPVRISNSITVTAYRSARPSMSPDAPFRGICSGAM